MREWVGASTERSKEKPRTKGAWFLAYRLLLFSPNGAVDKRVAEDAADHSRIELHRRVSCLEDYATVSFSFPRPSLGFVPHLFACGQEQRPHALSSLPPVLADGGIRYG